MGLQKPQKAYLGILISYRTLTILSAPQVLTYAALKLESIRDEMKPMVGQQLHYNETNCSLMTEKGM